MNPSTLFEQLFTFVDDSSDEDAPISASRRVFLISECSVPRVFDGSIHADDLECLYGREWVNDSVVNTYIKLLKFRSPLNIGMTNSFFYSKLKRDGPDEASDWWGIRQEPLTSYDKFIIPISTGSHWILIVLDFEMSALQLLDSLNGRYNATASNINKFLNYLGIPSLDVQYPNVARQTNGYDCGIFICEYANCIFNERPLVSFTQADTPKIRLKILNELIPFAR